MIVNRVTDLLRANCLYKQLSLRTSYSTSRLEDFPLGFVPQNVEHGWYEIWERNGFFERKLDKSRDGMLKMILPPPNVTGTLHLGHALTATIQDCLARWHRMKGDETLWIPGLDHAGIATQAVVEKYLCKTKGISRKDIGSEELMRYIDEWKNQKGGKIKEQLKEMGAILDWSREFYTLDQNHSAAVTEAYLILHQRNLIYRAKDLINWSPALRSALSDIEVDILPITGRTELQIPGYDRAITFGQIMTLSYKLTDSDDQLLVATTRPETIPGDVALAVHPNDSRYAKFIGKRVINPLTGNLMPVIADSAVIMDYGTGVLKITPAHDRTDYAVAKRHDLEIIDVIDEDGNMTASAKEFEGLPRFAARHKILENLSSRKILLEVNEHSSTLSLCSRSGDVIELLRREQWFVRSKNMAERALEAVRDGSLKIDPPAQEEQWYSWLGNIKDWCLSRQLSWGHRIPAYLCSNGQESKWIVAKSLELARKVAENIYGKNANVRQDEDVLDTWFSSALLPLSVMGWPKDMQHFNRNYPLTLMETGHDILFYWVARMVMLNLEITNRLPFKEVSLHGILCDGQGRKMSKSRGNVISPDNVIHGISLDGLKAQAEESRNAGILTDKELKRTIKVNSKIFPDGIPACGVDALRFTLCSVNVTNPRVTFEVPACHANKLFGNKIWQVGRYAVMMTEKGSRTFENPEILTVLDRWILSRLAHMVELVNDALSERALHKAVAAIKQFLYFEFCDFYVEGTKLGFKSNDGRVIDAHRYTLCTSLEVSLRIISPFMPYLSDDLYSRLARKLPLFSSYRSLLEAPYPLPERFNAHRDANTEASMKEIIKTINNIRGILAVANKISKPEVHIVPHTSEECNFYNDCMNLVKAVTKLKDVSVRPLNSYNPKENSLCNSIGINCHVYLILKDKEAFEAVKSKMEKKQLESEKKLQKMLMKEERSKVSGTTKRPREESSESPKRIHKIKRDF